MLDHRQLGRELEIFHPHPLVGAGLPIWLPNGAAVRYAIEGYLREVERLAGYQHVYSPPIAKQEMYARSGHLANFADDMFPPMVDPDGGEAMMLRPSLCPHHAMVYQSKGRSYRELPLRIGEFGGQYRAERSGVLSGLSRVRSIWLNDGHVFCAPEQAFDELSAVLADVDKAHRALGFRAEAFRLSLRGDLGGAGKYAGAPDEWDRAEELLRDVLVAAGVPFYEKSGEAAFYGPKIDIQIRDVAGREMSLATIQVDFVQPERFDLEYVDAGGARRRPLMLHRSLGGGMERLVGHLLEVHQGALPAWYAPVQLVVAPVSEAQDAAARRLADAALRLGLRARVSHDGSLGLRIREAIRQKIPYVAVIGAREAADDEVSLRLRDGAQLPAMRSADALGFIAKEAAVPEI
jgi:threonyl-tRNA synthetase